LVEALGFGGTAGRSKRKLVLRLAQDQLKIHQRNLFVSHTRDLAESALCMRGSGSCFGPIFSRELRLPAEEEFAPGLPGAIPQYV